jgi:hypothetical protein
MAKTKDQKEAIRVREKLAEPAVDPMTIENDPEEPPRDSKLWHPWAYSRAFARGIEKATGRPFTPPPFKEPKPIMIALLRTHCKGIDGKLLRGEDTLRWIEDVVCDFRQHADERAYGFGVLGWSPMAFARWLDAGRPKAQTSQSTTASDRRAHIAVRKA